MTDIKNNVDSMVEIHELALLFPEMQEQEFQELKSDIEKYGLQCPILILDGKVVDGRHRLRACEELGIEPVFQQIPNASNDEVEQIVTSINLHRRHLSPAQRAMLAARLSNTSKGSNQHTAGAVSQSKLAQELSISLDSIQRAKKVCLNGIPALITAVDAGKIDISSAAKIAKLSKEDQLQLNLCDIKVIQDVSKAINKAKFEQRRIQRLKDIEDKRANNKPLDSTLGNFNLIYADPPWDYMGELAVGYPCMTIKEIAEMRIKDITTDDAVLFLWCSSSLLKEALSVIESWGFDFKTSAIWDKQISGQGAYFRQSHEILMLATKGKIPEVPFGARPSSVLSYPRREHSQKPIELYQIIDSMYPEFSKVELFCRGEPAIGWTGWGNECIQSPQSA